MELLIGEGEIITRVGEGETFGTLSCGKKIVLIISNPLTPKEKRSAVDEVINTTYKSKAARIKYCIGKIFR